MGESCTEGQCADNFFLFLNRPTTLFSDEILSQNYGIVIIVFISFATTFI